MYYYVLHWQNNCALGHLIAIGTRGIFLLHICSISHNSLAADFPFGFNLQALQQACEWPLRPLWPQKHLMGESSGSVRGLFGTKGISSVFGGNFARYHGCFT